MAFQDYKQSHTDIKDLLTTPDKFVEQIVTVKGWIKHFRKSGGKGKNIGFARLYDGCIGTLQIIYDMKSLADDNKGYFDDILKRGKHGMCIMTTGLIVKSPKAEQPIEMQAHTYEIYGDVMDPDTFPITKDISLDSLRLVQQFRCRTDTHIAIARIKSFMKLGMAEYFAKHGFIEVQVPCISDNQCEGGCYPFRITTIMNDDISLIPTKDGKIDYTQDFFKKPCYLTVSGQLHLEAIILGGLNKAYTFTTAFRAEKSTGPRHAAEFWMMELEFAFGKLEDNMKVNEGCIKHCFGKILDECYPELEFLQNKFKPNLIETIKKYASVPFVISSHAECVKLMLDDIASGKVKIDPEKKPDSDLCTFKEVPGYSDDLSKDHERYITEVLFRGMPVFVRFFPAPIKSFYMPKIDEGAEVEHVDGFDLLFPEIGEIVGGSQRESDYNKLLMRMREMGVNPESLQYYLDLRKYGTCEHGGSGVGMDRLLMVCTGIFNIRDMIPFPRAYEHCYF